MTDGDGQEYPIGSIVIEGTYYQQIKIDKIGIIIVDYMPGQKVLHYSHLVLATQGRQLRGGGESIVPKI